MNGTLEKLESILKSELDVHVSFLVSALELNRVLREEDLVKIDRQRHVQDETVCRIEKLEEQRREYCAAIAQSLGIAKRPVKMAMLIEKLPQQWRDRLGALQRALREKISELSKISVSNRLLLEEGLRIADNTIAMVRKVGRKYGAYGHYGQTLSSPLTTSIINRTV